MLLVLQDPPYIQALYGAPVHEMRVINCTKAPLLHICGMH